jgi:hypothetical protein
LGYLLDKLFLEPKLPHRQMSMNQAKMLFLLARQEMR